MKKTVVFIALVLNSLLLSAQSYDNWERLDRKILKLQNGSTTITNSGVYELTGILHNGMITVASNDSGTVYVVFNNAHLVGSQGSPFYIKKAENVVIILEKNTSNSISYKGEDSDDDSIPNAALYSSANLSIVGEGALSLKSTYVDAIKTKENLTLENTRLSIETPEDAIDSNGDILINGGFYTIHAGDDAIHSESAITVESGTIDIQSCVEGIEGAYVTIHGGTMCIISTDDAINTPEDYSLLAIHGGKLYLETHGEDTDGIDSNNDILISGGEITINMSDINRYGQALDYDGTLTHTGGVIKDENGNIIDTTVRQRHNR